VSDPVRPKILLLKPFNFSKVVAVASMSRDPYVAKSVDLLSEGIMPSFSAIKGGKNILDIDLAGQSSSN
jgi:hypothetical protein